MRMPSIDDRFIRPEDIDVCLASLRGGSRSFHAASLLLPSRVRAPAAALYAFCRLADDAVDLEADPRQSLIRLRERLRAAYLGNPFPMAADRAFAATVSRFQIPRALPEALLEGFAWDAGGRRYETIDELLDYAARVAGSVGAMMALVMGARSLDTVARACELGMAMQLTNIARDVGEDARAGRLYLPLAWLREGGVDPDTWLARPVFSETIGAVVGRLLAEADALYERAGLGIAALPASCRPGIRTARKLYQRIGRAVERRGLDSVGARAVVPFGDKLRLAAVAIFEGSPLVEGRIPRCHAAASYLVEATSTSLDRHEPTSRRTSWFHDIDARIAWTLDLFGRLERREQLERGR
jgi:phytoene synthase